MNLKRLPVFVFFLMLFCCSSEKKYSDYDESEFYEVQGVINTVNLTSDPFDSATRKNISFSYFIDREIPKIGIERDLEMFEAKKGYPLIVLVHKEDENISFYGRVGLLDSLNFKEKAFLSKHFQKEIDEIK